ncbi:MAG: PPC domain-containing protein [Planctomycetales bacterium]|nr:PPC domain-containing protein [Planctomycetales bacterium]
MQKICSFVALAAIAFSFAVRPAVAVEPSLGGIAPYGVQRGVETEVLFQGGRLQDAKELLFYSPGIAVASLEAVNDGTVKAKLKVAADCRLGIHAVRVRTLTGVSNLRTFTVGALPEVKEVEPNSLFDKPQAVTMNVTMSGVVDAEDVDHFVVDLKKGQRLTAELEGLRLGNTFFDPYLAILNSARFELSRSDDAALLNQDCLCSIVAPEDGKYIVQIRESSYGGNGACTYRLHIGGFPRPTAVYPAGGKPGEVLNVKYIGDAAGDVAAQVTLPTAVSHNETGLFAQDANGIAPSPNVVRVIDLPNALEVEPNDALAQATPSSAAPCALNGIIDKPGDVDYFKFSAKAGQQFDIRVYSRKPLRSPLDSVLTITNAAGAGLVGNDDSGGPDSYVRFGAPADGDYLAVVQDQLKAGGPNYVYRVEITPVVPALTMALPERQQYIPNTLTVYKGNRMALMMSSQRANFGGPIDITFGGLPAGMTTETLQVRPDQTDVPVLFTAAADAAPAGALADVVGKLADPKQPPLEGHLRQRCMLIRGQNNIDVWGHDADRMAVSLGDEVPFKIDIVQPKAPLVRNGSMNLKIVATRKEGFKAPIQVFMLYNPPGVSSSGSISIPEGKNEALIPFTANGGAPIGVWKIVCIGRAPYLNGGVEVASQLADLTISDQFFTFAFDKSAVEQAKETEVVVKMEKKIDFDGNAKCELVGIPAGTTTTPIEFNKDTKELVFKVTCSKDARPGRYPSLLCVSTFMLQGEPVVHTLGTGELRIDAPLPPKPMTAAAPPPVAAPAAAPPPMPAAPKRLTRLEQLRLEKEQAGKK